MKPKTKSIIKLLIPFLELLAIVAIGISIMFILGYVYALYGKQTAAFASMAIGILFVVIALIIRKKNKGHEHF